ncbi:hypothetical protein IWZ00DRAFT_128393 [Phyllosticta capitalensis]
MVVGQHWWFLRRALARLGTLGFETVAYVDFCTSPSTLHALKGAQSWCGGAAKTAFLPVASPCSLVPSSCSSSPISWSLNMTKLAPATRLAVMRMDYLDDIEEKRPGRSATLGINGAVAAAARRPAEALTPTASGQSRAKAESESGPVVSGKCLFHVSARSSIVYVRYKKNHPRRASPNSSFPSLFLYPHPPPPLVLVTAPSFLCVNQLLAARFGLSLSALSLIVPLSQTGIQIKLLPLLHHCWPANLPQHAPAFLRRRDTTLKSLFFLDTSPHSTSSLIATVSLHGPPFHSAGH